MFSSRRGSGARWVSSLHQFSRFMQGAGEIELGGVLSGVLRSVEWSLLSSDVGSRTNYDQKTMCELHGKYELDRSEAFRP